MVNIDKSYRFDKTRIFKYDEELKKHVFACYEGINNLSTGIVSSLAYNLPLQNIGTISLRFKYEISTSDFNQIISLSSINSEHFGIYVDKTNELKVILNGDIVDSTNSKYIVDGEWHNLIIRFRNNKLVIYLKKLKN